MRCPTKAEVLAMPKSLRWRRFDAPGCNTGCRDGSVGDEAPHCWKKVKKDCNSSADVEKAKAAMKAREEAAKAACRPPESTGSLIESEDSTVNTFHQKF